MQAVGSDTLDTRLLYDQFPLFSVHSNAQEHTSIYNVYNDSYNYSYTYNYNILTIAIIIAITIARIIAIIITIRKAISIPIISMPGDYFFGYNLKFFKHGLEWNYFLGVIIFYLLTFFMWKPHSHTD